MSDIVCHCGNYGALLAQPDHKLIRYGLCKKHLDESKINELGLKYPILPPSMPEIFRDTDISRLHPKVQNILNWKPEGDISGLLLHGTTGLGKTRGIWEITRKMWCDEVKLNNKQIEYKFLTMRKLEGMIEVSFEERNHNKLINDLINIKLLVLDDLGKEKLTTRMAIDLFCIIDERSSNRRTTIISTNFNSNALLERFDKKDIELGVALIRRLKDYYHCVGIGA
mgnify:CR=1 FL=1